MSKGQNNDLKTRKVEVFRPGTFRAMSGQDFAFTADDVAAMAANYDAEAAPAPVVVGHPQHDDPAFGWATGFEVNEAGTLVADLSDLAPEFVTAVEEGRYRKVSMKFFPPNAAANPVPGTYYPRHIGFLGGAAPAVSGLKPVEFVAGGEGELIEFTFSTAKLVDPEFSLRDATEQTSGLFRGIREFFIEKYGREETDKVLPDWRINWVEDAGQEPEPEINPGFSDPQHTKTKKEPQMSGENTDLEKRTKALDERERKLRRDESVSFADGLIDEGKLLPVQKDGVVALLEELGGQSETEIAFSANGETKTSDPASLLKDVLNAQPVIVPQGEIGDGEETTTSGPAFASPDGEAVDPDGLALHHKALAYQTQNPGTAYIDAVAAAQGA